RAGAIRDLGLGALADFQGEVLARLVADAAHLVGEALDRGAESGDLELAPQPLARAAGHRADPQVDAAVAILDDQVNRPAVEALRGEGRDRIAEQYRVGEAVDREIASR